MGKGMELLRGVVVSITMLTFLIWLLLLILCWPLALAALLLYPIVWLLALPFRLVGITLEGVFRLLTAIILMYSSGVVKL